MKKFKVVAIDLKSAVEIVGLCETFKDAQDLQLRCEEGDDKHDPCVYLIEETVDA